MYAKLFLFLMLDYQYDCIMVYVTAHYALLIAIDASMALMIAACMTNLNKCTNDRECAFGERHDI